jgi:hypothetical protein
VLAFIQCPFAFSQFVVAAAVSAAETKGSAAGDGGSYKIDAQALLENHFNPTNSGSGRFQFRHFDK